MRVFHVQIARWPTVHWWRYRCPRCQFDSGIHFPKDGMDDLQHVTHILMLFRVAFTELDRQESERNERNVTPESQP